mmetsp:Transcript_34446/g.75185  ORF Transcript_34446/g.75185 Transcript_34446/m.75185 type:complete len:213 (+) Transcript_34446:178-816(+)
MARRAAQRLDLGSHRPKASKAGYLSWPSHLPAATNAAPRSSRCNLCHGRHKILQLRSLKAKRLCSPEDVACILGRHLSLQLRRSACESRQELQQLWRLLLQGGNRPDDVGHVVGRHPLDHPWRRLHQNRYKLKQLWLLPTKRGHRPEDAAKVSLSHPLSIFEGCIDQRWHELLSQRRRNLPQCRKRPDGNGQWLYVCMPGLQHSHRGLSQSS